MRNRKLTSKYLLNIVRLLLPVTIQAALFSANGYGQPGKYDSREVTIVQGDSIIKTSILTGKVLLKPVNDLYYYWISNEKLFRNRGDYSHYLIHGSYIVFDIKQRMITKGEFRLGKKEGIWKHWHPGGEIKEICKWQNGKRNGKCFRFGESGNLLSITKYKEGKLHGNCKYYIDQELIHKRFRNGEETVQKPLFNFLNELNVVKSHAPFSRLKLFGQTHYYLEKNIEEWILNTYNKLLDSYKKSGNKLV